MSSRRAETSSAFAPGHVTGVFAPSLEARDPRGRGSTGAGLVLELGATARASFWPGPARSLRVRDEDGASLPISEEVARRLRPARPGRLVVSVSHELPVGQGFGMSAAGATATALAVASLSGRPTAEAVEVAHLAELFGRGGLGGVAAILGGGFELRRRPGIPPWGRIVHHPFDRPIFVGVVGGPIPSPAILSDLPALARLRAASTRLEPLVERPTVDGFLEASERFTDSVRLAPPALRRALSGLRQNGAWAAQAMFGRSFFAVPRSRSTRRSVVEWLEGSGVRAVEIHAARGGAHLLPAQSF